MGKLCLQLRFFGLVAAVLAGLANSANAGNMIRVPADQPSIQSAIDAASDGDMVVVSEGTYSEIIDFNGKAITVKSIGDPAKTIIDGGQLDSVVKFTSGEGAESLLSGFTITNGAANSGGGIAIINSSPTIQKNIVIHNRACDGAGILVNSGSPVIRNNTIQQNGQSGCSGGAGGGGIEVRGTGSAQIISNLIQQNNAGNGAGGGGLSLWAAGTPTVMNNTFIQNKALTGGAISMYNLSDALIVQNAFSINTAGQGGAIFYLVPTGANGPTIVNNTFFHNKNTQGGQGSAIYANNSNVATHLYNNIIDGVSGEIAVYCGNLNTTVPPVFFNNDVYALQGTTYGGICTDQTGTRGNISVNPLFASTTSLTLKAGSPAVDTGSNSAPNLPARDIMGKPRIVDGNHDHVATVDMGAHEYQ